MKIITMDNGECYELRKLDSVMEFSVSAAMRHLLIGGWIEMRGYSNASYFTRLNNQGNPETIFKCDDEPPSEGWKRRGLDFSEMKEWKLIAPRDNLANQK